MVNDLPGEASLTELNDLSPGMTVTGPWRSPVELVAVTHHDRDSSTIVYRTSDGRIDEDLIFAHDLSTLRIGGENRWSFDADSTHFQLAAEVLRIRMAAAGDPRVAVGISDISPLPHQIRAVYGELLPPHAAAFPAGR